MNSIRYVKLDRKCPICMSGEAEYVDKLHFVNEKGNPLPQKYDVCICKMCGFTFADMVSSQNDFNSYYKTFNNYALVENVKEYDSVTSNHNFCGKLLQIMDIDTDADIIDLGCGGGELLRHLKSMGYRNVKGLDPSSASIDKLGYEKIRGVCKNIFDEIDEEDKHAYDVVFSIAVIEHVYDVRGYIESLIGYCKEDGYIIINAPDVTGFENYISPKANYFNQEHINYFSITSMDNLLGLYGYLRLNEEYAVTEMGEKNIVAVYKNFGTKKIVEYDSSSKASVIRFYERIQDKEKVLKQVIDKVCESKLPIFVYGAGQYFRQIVGEFPELMERVEAIIDNNTLKQGETICGKKIVGSSILCEYESEKIVLVCSIKNSSVIKRQLLNDFCNIDIYIV